jgi:hypothetical protein
MTAEESTTPPAGPEASIDWGLRPRRADGIELSEVTDGYLVYQVSRDRVHYLNATAALLLEICDGSLTAEQLPPFLVAAFQLPEAPRAEVAACLEKLLSEGLLEADPPEGADS